MYSPSVQKYENVKDLLAKKQDAHEKLSWYLGSILCFLGSAFRDIRDI